MTLAHINEQQLDGGYVKVWTNDLREVVIHHQSGLSIALDTNQAVELFQWLKVELARRGVDEALR